MLCLRGARGRAERRLRWLAAAFFGLVLSVCGGLIAARSLATLQVVEPQRVANFPENQPDLASDSALLVASTISSVVVPVPSAEPALSARAPSSSELLAALHTTPVSMFTTRWCPHYQRATIEAVVASVERRLGVSGVELSVASLPALRD